MCQEIFTIQRKQIAKILLEQKIYMPDFSLSKNYPEDMMSSYKILLEKYKEINKKDILTGLIFGFKKNKDIAEVNDLYDFFIKNPVIARAFNWWNKDYCVMRIKVPDDTNLVEIDFNNFIMLSIHESNDNKLKELLEQEKHFNFEKYITELLYSLGKSDIEPISSSFMQVHYSHISIENLIEIYPMINYMTGDIYPLEKTFLELKNRYKK